MPTSAGSIALAIYAVLLAVGGIIGFVKAGSRPSLIAGLASGLVAALAAVLSRSGNTGLYLGILLAVVMTVLFGVRFARGRKFMPSGLLGLVSLAVLVVLAVVVAGSPA